MRDVNSSPDYSNIPAALGVIDVDASSKMTVGPGINSEILSQNAQMEHIARDGVLGHPEFVSLGRQALQTRQTDSVNRLLEVTADVDYLGLYLTERSLRDTIAQLEARTQEIDLRENPEAQSIERDAKTLESILPETHEKAEQLAEEMKKKVVSEERKIIESEIAGSRAQLEQLSSSIQDAGTAWAIPKLVRITDEGVVPLDADPEADNDPEIIAIEQFPTEERHAQYEVSEKVKRRFNGRIDNASELLASILAEQPKLVFGRSALVESLYGVNPTDEVKSRVSALVSNFELGKVGIIGDVLEQLGLVFQKGCRTYHYIDGKQIGGAHPVYRAIAPGDPEFQSTKVTSKDMPGKERRDGGWVTIQFPKTVGSEKRETKSIKPSNASDTKPENSEIEIPEILEEFADDVREVLNRLEHSGAFSLDIAQGLSNDLVNKILPKRSRSSRTALKNAKLLHHSRWSAHASGLTVKELVMLSVYEKHRDIIRRNGDVLATAVSIVDQLIATYTVDDK